MDYAQVAAAPAEWTLAGRTFLVSPLTDLDRGELDNWVRGLLIRAARESLNGDGLDVREETLATALRTSLTVFWDGPEGRAQIFGTTRGMARFIRQSLKARHPDVTAEWLAERLTSQTIDEFMDVFKLANSGSYTAEKKGARTESLVVPTSPDAR